VEDRDGLLEAGTTVQDKYRVLQQLGTGSNGITYAAEVLSGPQVRANPGSLGLLKLLVSQQAMPCVMHLAAAAYESFRPGAVHTETLVVVGWGLGGLSWMW
jgi:hypothetical protein